MLGLQSLVKTAGMHVAGELDLSGLLTAFLIHSSSGP